MTEWKHCETGGRSLTGRSVALLLGLLLLVAPVNGAWAAQSASEWISLFGPNWDRDWGEAPFNKAAKYRGKRIFFFRDGVVTTDEGRHSRAHLYYVGPVENAKFRNFEVKLDVRLEEKANGGLYFRTPFKAWGWPKHAFEIKFNNTHFQHDKTGSLHRTVRVREPTVRDGEWFELHLTVDGNRFVSRINGQTLVEWQRPPTDSHSTVGTFALQKHTRDISFRNMRVRILPD